MMAMPMASPLLKAGVASAVIVGFGLVLVRQQGQNQRLLADLAQLQAEHAAAAPVGVPAPIPPPSSGPSEEVLQLRGEVARLRAGQNEMARLKSENSRLKAMSTLPGGSPERQPGEAFLAANALQPNVLQTASGLQYKVLTAGAGRTPKPTDSVKVHYHGTLIDGTVFDSSIDRGEPATFPMGGLIPGWTEALQLMKEGDKWRVFVPAKLAYGDRAVGDKIGPSSTLIFDLELLEIVPAK